VLAGLVLGFLLLVPPTAFASYRDVAANAAGAVSYWRLGESAGATAAADERGVNTGSYSGVALGTPSLLAGDPNTAGTFSTGSHVQVPDSTSLHLNGGFSLEAWIKESSAPGTRPFDIISKTNSYYLALTTSNQLQVGFVTGGSYRTLNAPTPIAVGTRYHVVGTFDGSTLKLYVNGAQVASGGQSGAVDVNSLPLQISTWQNGSSDGSFLGVIDDVGVYNQALGSSQVYYHWLAGSTRGPSPGVVSQTTWNPSQSDPTSSNYGKVTKEVSLTQQAGARWARVSADWSSLEPVENTTGLDTGYNQAALKNLDDALKQYHDSGVQVALMIDGTPCWASAEPVVSAGGHRNCATSPQQYVPYWRPADYSKYARVASFLASRYRTATYGVHVYEIWNEPNLCGVEGGITRAYYTDGATVCADLNANPSATGGPARFWPSQPAGSAAGVGEYVDLLRSAAPAVRQADPQAVVVSAGLSGNDAAWLQRFYSNSISPRPYFDAVGVHPYSSTYSPTTCYQAQQKPQRDQFCALQNVRDVMVSNGDTGKEVWATEFGWQTTLVSEATQASDVTSAFDVLEHGAPGGQYSPPFIGPFKFVRAAFVYSMREESGYGLLRDDWNGTAWSQKPAYGNFKAWATDPTRNP
jgi:hypothetical protein